MKQLDNGWVNYWENRVGSGGDYYGKKGSNADKMIRVLKISSKDIVFDIGCATGAHLSDITSKTGAKCYGIDISPVAIKLNKDKRIQVKVADMEKTTFPSDFFTKVFSLGVFEHTPRSKNVFLELNRVMKTGGLAYITVPNKYSFFHITKNIKMRMGTWDLGYEKSFTSQEIKNLLAKTGFILESYWVEPHIQNANIFNWFDNILNKLNRRYFGFFIHFTARKVKDVTPNPLHS